MRVARREGLMTFQRDGVSLTAQLSAHSPPFCEFHAVQCRRSGHARDAYESFCPFANAAAFVREI